MKATIQVQSVLYNSHVASIKKSISSLMCSAKLAEVSLIFNYGDASPESCVSSSQLIELESLSGDSFQYNFFNENTGFGKGHNLLAQAASSEYLLIINPDIIVNDIFFNEMLDAFAHNPLCGIAEARQIPLEHPKSYNQKTGETEWSSGACMMIPTRLFSEIGGFDWKSFWMYCEDVDISWRVRSRGSQTIYRPRATALHPKKLNHTGVIIASDTECYYSAYSGLMLAYKWNNPARLQKLKRIFAKSDDPYQSAALRQFEEAERNHELPEQIRNANVAKFYPDGNYAKHRF